MLGNLKKYQYFQSDSEYLEKFCERKYNDLEKEKYKQLEKKFIDFQDKVYAGKNMLPPGYLDFGYLEDFGYFTVTEADRGWVNVENYGLDLDASFKGIVIDILFAWGIEYECHNRKMLQENFQNRFGNGWSECYQNGFSYVEYALEKWKSYYDNRVPQDIINYYANYLNSLPGKPDVNWSYDETVQGFKCLKRVIQK